MLIVAILLVIGYLFVTIKRYNYCNQRMINENLMIKKDEAGLILFMVLLWPLYYHDVSYILDIIKVRPQCLKKN